MHMLCADPANKIHEAESTGPCVQCVHNSPECMLYRWSIRMSRLKHRIYAVLKGSRERDIVRSPAPVQITPELPTATAFYSEM